MAVVEEDNAKNAATSPGGSGVSDLLTSPDRTSMSFPLSPDGSGEFSTIQEVDHGNISDSDSSDMSDHGDASDHGGGGAPIEF